LLDRVFWRLKTNQNQNYHWENSMSSTFKVKKAQKFGICRLDLKSYSPEHQINQSHWNFFQKMYVCYLKSEKEPKIRMRTICWGCDLWGSSGICSWSALVYIIYWRLLKGYQVLPFSHLCGWSADLSHLRCVRLSEVYWWVELGFPACVWMGGCEWS
jgi:hypothetical protein